MMYMKTLAIIASVVLMAFSLASIQELAVVPRSRNSIKCLTGGAKEAKGTDAAAPKLADGCYHIFLDVGANIGVHGRFLMEPDKYPKAKVGRKIFDNQFGALGKQRDNRDICVFMFEPNPAHHSKINKTAEAYAAMGWRYQLIPVGVSDEVSTLQFFRDDKRHEEWGFNAFKSLIKTPDAVAADIPVIRLASWIEEHVHNRALPEIVYGSYNNTAGGSTGAPRVVMKMDIEAMEFRVLPDMLYSGALCNNVDYVFGELHFHRQWYPMVLDKPNKVTFQDSSMGKAYMKSFLTALKINPTCKTVFVQRDDEKYLHDGQPLPKVKNMTNQHETSLSFSSTGNSTLRRILKRRIAAQRRNNRARKLRRG